MRPLRVVVLNELAYEVVEVLRAARHEVIEALLLERLNEPLGARALARLLIKLALFQPPEQTRSLVNSFGEGLRSGPRDVVSN